LWLAYVVREGSGSDETTMIDEITIGIYSPTSVTNTKFGVSTAALGDIGSLAAAAWRTCAAASSGGGCGGVTRSV
jgi:hypothetical protein